MDISNRALAMFLLAAIVISLGGTIVSLNKLGSLQPTGYASSDTGRVNLSVGSSLSITTEDADLVDFGVCYPGTVPITINSENTLATPTNCSGFTQNNISVRNDGNVNANVTLAFSDWGEAGGAGGTFLLSTSDSSAIAYKTGNGSRQAGSSGGCFGEYQPTYVNVTSGAERVGCGNLGYGVNTANSFITNFQIILPPGAPTGESAVTVTYTGYSTV